MPDTSLNQGKLGVPSTSPSINPIPGRGPRWWQDSAGVWWYQNLATDIWEPYHGRVSDAWDTMEDWEEDPKPKRQRPS